MARAQKDGILYILDVSSDNEFFIRAKNCIEKSFQQLIFTNPKDEVGLFVMGADTKNHLNDNNPDFYLNLLEAIPFVIPTWRHLQFLDGHVLAGKEETDWLDAIVLGLDYIKNLLQSRKFSHLEIVLMTPKCGRVAGLDQMDDIIKSFEELQIELKVVMKEKSASLGEFERLINETNGKVFQIEEFEENLRFFKPRNVRPTPWSKELTIGTRIGIQCSAYLRITDPKMIPSFKVKAISSEEPVAREKRFIKDFKEVDVDIDNLMNGYMYGSSAIPNYDFLSVNFSEGCSTFALLGFCYRRKIYSEYLVGDGAYCVVPNTKYPVSIRKFNALVHALNETDCVLIARKMYSKSSSPKFNVLFPGFLEEGNISSLPILTMIEVLFGEDLIELKLPNLKTENVSNDQMDAIDALMDAMELKEDELNQFLIDPAPQHILRSISKRALKPKEPISPMDEDIKALITIPESFKEKSKELAEKVQNLFPLEVIKKQTKFEQLIQKMGEIGIFTDDESSNGAPDEQEQSESNAPREIGTITPAEDYDNLIKMGESFRIVSDQMEQILSQLVFKAFKVQEKKVAKGLLMYRQHSIALGAFRYNEFIANFKNDLLLNNHEELFKKIIVQFELGIITEDESENSTRTKDEAVEFYKINQPVPKAAAPIPMDDDDDLDNLLE